MSTPEIRHEDDVVTAARNGTDSSAASPPDVASGDRTDDAPVTDPAADGERATVTESEAEYGRIGYGRIARYTPMVLAVLLMIALVTAAVLSREEAADDSDSTQPISEVIQTGRMGQAAPDVTVTLFDGSTLRLADLRGSVVVVNFWASWCEPCREEMPALEAVSTAPPDVGVPVRVIGIAVNSDTEDDARAFAQEMGVTYPTGRDGGTDNEPAGPIQRAFDAGDFVPTTVFIAPDGTIAMVHVGPLDEEMLQFYIERAATPAATEAAG